MSETYTKAVINCATNQIEHIPMTAEEIAGLEQARQEFMEKEAEKEAEAQRIASLKESAKSKLVTGQALTAEEAAVLVI